jgi:hypothetical protein
MYAYPLNFEIGDSGLDSDVKLKDAKKQIPLRGSKMTDSEQNEEISWHTRSNTSR